MEPGIVVMLFLIVVAIVAASISLSRDKRIAETTDAENDRLTAESAGEALQAGLNAQQSAEPVPQSPNVPLPAPVIVQQVMVPFSRLFWASVLAQLFLGFVGLLLWILTR